MSAGSSVPTVDAAFDWLASHNYKLPASLCEGQDLECYDGDYARPNCPIAGRQDSFDACDGVLVCWFADVLAALEAENAELKAMCEGLKAAIGRHWWYRTPELGTRCIWCGAHVHFDLGIDDIVHECGCEYVRVLTTPSRWEPRKETG